MNVATGTSNFSLLAIISSCITSAVVIVIVVTIRERIHNQIEHRSCRRDIGRSIVFAFEICRRRRFSIRVKKQLLPKASAGWNVDGVSVARGQRNRFRRAKAKRDLHEDARFRDCDSIALAKASHLLPSLRAQTADHFFNNVVASVCGGHEGLGEVEVRGERSVVVAVDAELKQLWERGAKALGELALVACGEVRLLAALREREQDFDEVDPASVLRNEVVLEAAHDLVSAVLPRKAQRGPETVQQERKHVGFELEREVLAFVFVLAPNVDELVELPKADVGAGQLHCEFEVDQNDGHDQVEDDIRVDDDEAAEEERVDRRAATLVAVALGFLDHGVAQGANPVFERQEPVEKHQGVIELPEVVVARVEDLRIRRNVEFCVQIDAEDAEAKRDEDNERAHVRDRWERVHDGFHQNRNALGAAEETKDSQKSEHAKDDQAFDVRSGEGGEPDENETEVQLVGRVSEVAHVESRHLEDELEREDDLNENVESLQDVVERLRHLVVVDGDGQDVGEDATGDERVEPRLGDDVAVHPDRGEPVLLRHHRDRRAQVHEQLLRLHPDFLLLGHRLGAVDGRLDHVVVVDDEGDEELREEEAGDGEEGDEEEALDLGAVLLDR